MFSCPPKIVESTLLCAKMIFATFAKPRKMVGSFRFVASLLYHLTAFRVFRDSFSIALERLFINLALICDCTDRLSFNAKSFRGLHCIRLLSSNAFFKRYLDWQLFFWLLFRLGTYWISFRQILHVLGKYFVH